MKTHKLWAALAVICAFVVVAAARNHSEKAKTQPGHEPTPYWAFTGNPPAPASSRPAKTAYPER